jgi:hypothetical protein
MIAEFEQRLVEVLGSRLPAPFTGRVVVAPGQDGAQSRIVVGVVEATPLEPDFRHRRTEVVPGSADGRRVVRLECRVALTVRPNQNTTRTQQMQMFDATLFALGAEDVLTGTALNDNVDRGFFINDARLDAASTPLVTSAESPLQLTLVVRGLFWPVGLAGQAGVQIGEIRIRGVLLPIQLSPAAPRLTAGGEAVELTIRVATPGSFSVQSGATAALPFGSLAVAVVTEAGAPGNGTLAGGEAGLGNTRIVPLVNNEAAISYTPPAEAGLEHLVIALDDHEGGQGVELGRMPLRVRAD